MLLGDLDQPLPTMQRERNARWVLKCWQQVDELRRAIACLRSKGGRERLDDHAMLVHRDRQIVRLLMLPRPERAHEHGRLGDDRVAVIEGDSADQV